MAERLARTTFETGIEDKLATVDVYTQTTAKDPIDALLDTVGIDIDDIGKLLGGLTGIPPLLNDFFGDYELASGAGGFINGITSELNNALTEVSGNSSFVNSLSSVMKDVATSGVPKLTDFQTALSGLKTTVFPANFQDKASLVSIGKYMLSSGSKLGVPGTYAAVQASLKNHPSAFLDVTKSFLVTTALTPNVSSLTDLSNGSLAGQIKTLNPKFIGDFIGNFKLPETATPAQYKELGLTITAAFTKIDPNWNKTLKADGTYSNDSSAMVGASDDFIKLMQTASVSAGVPLASRTITNEQLIIPEGATDIAFSYPADANISGYVYRDGISIREIILSDGTKITEFKNVRMMIITRVYVWSATTSTTVPTVGGGTFVSGPYTPTTGSTGAGVVGVGPFSATTPTVTIDGWGVVVGGTPTGASTATRVVPLASRNINEEKFTIPDDGSELNFSYPNTATRGEYLTSGDVKTQLITLLDGTRITTTREVFVSLLQIRSILIIRRYVWSDSGVADTSISLPNRTITVENFTLPAGMAGLNFVYPASATIGQNVNFSSYAIQTVTLIDGTTIAIRNDYIALEVTRTFVWRQNASTGANSATQSIPLPSRSITTEKHTIPPNTTELPFVYPADAKIGGFFSITEVRRQTVTLSDNSVIEIFYEYLKKTATRLFTWDTRTTNEVTLGAGEAGLIKNANGLGNYPLPARSITREQFKLDAGVTELPFVYPAGSVNTDFINHSGLIVRNVTLPDGTIIVVTYNSVTSMLVREFTWSATTSASQNPVTVGGTPAVTSNQPTIPAGATLSTETQAPLIVRDGTSSYTSVGNYVAPDGSLFSVLNPYTGGFTLVTETPGQSTVVTTSKPTTLPTTLPAGDPLAATSLVITQNPLILGAVVNDFIRQSQSENGNANDSTPTLNAAAALASAWVDLP